MNSIALTDPTPPSRGPQVGVVYPTFELPQDPGATREYVFEVERLGFAYLGTFDHVVGSVASDSGGRARSSIGSSFHEALVFLGWVAGMTTLQIATSVLILPQRQTALVAKQAAELSVLTNGGFRLGVGLGWHQAEYEALGVPFAGRASRFEEQLHVLRTLWGGDSSSFSGRFHSLPDVGIAPRPPTGQVPLWLGAAAPAAIERAGRLADGWFCMTPFGDAAREQIELFHESARAVGRSPDELGVDALVHVGREQLSDAEATLTGWHELGASHITVETLRDGLTGLHAHLEHLGDVAQALQLVPGTHTTSHLDHD